MRHGDLMKDSFYAGIIFEIEQKIVEVDQLARSEGVVFTDSQVISALTKVLGAAEGKPAKTGAISNRRDELLAGLSEKLKEVRGKIFESEVDHEPKILKPLDTADWVKALRCVIESARMRKGSTAGGRNYLDFLEPFLAQSRRNSA